MNIHEYQAKDILASYGVRIQRGIVAESKENAVKAAKELHGETGTDWFVIKAQIHAGGRGKGGGVKLAKSIDEVLSISDLMHAYLLSSKPPREALWSSAA